MPKLAPAYIRLTETRRRIAGHTRYTYRNRHQPRDRIWLFWDVGCVDGYAVALAADVQTLRQLTRIANTYLELTARHR